MQTRFENIKLLSKDKLAMDFQNVQKFEKMSIIKTGYSMQSYLPGL